MPDKILGKTKLRLKHTSILVLICITIIFPILIYNAPINFGKAHSNVALPKEIFSLWNDTNPTLDGSIEFDAKNMSKEWSSAAVYDMYETGLSPSAKVLLQNDDTNLFIGFDMTEYQTDPNPNFYGCAVYLDRNHNGLLDNNDASVVYYNFGNGTEYVAFRLYYESLGKWVNVDTSTLGVSLSNNAVIFSDISGSYFESIAHRQYEIRIPLAVIQASPGEITGIGLEVFHNYNLADGTTTWPGFEVNPNKIRLIPGGWGDLYLGQSSGYVDYVIEDNLNIEFSADKFAVGENNNTYLVTGDINGDADQELIIGSNRKVSGEENILTIFDYSGGELTQIWKSIGTSHQSNMPLPLGIIAYDFDLNGEDEIYVVGTNQNVFRLYDWNTTGTPNFDSSENCYSYSQSLTGSIDIGDVDNDGNVELVVGASDGKVVVVQYASGTDTFSLKHTHGPATLLGSTVTRIQAVEVADMDNDGLFELIYSGQTTTNDTLGTAAIQIVERSLFSYADNPTPSDDDLPLASSATTVDEHIHSILVDDVDNDAVTEVVIVGKDYLKIFGKQTYTNPSPPIEILVNGTSSLDMSGGVALGDINKDGNDELIFGAANGTLYFATITDSGSDSLSYNIDWSSDIGHSPGFKEAMTVLDIDVDSDNEIILGDNYGQIMTIGNGTAPSVTITSPSYGSSRTDTNVLVSWNAIDDYSMHHFDIYVNETFYGKVGGSQRGATLALGEGENRILINGYDTSGHNDSSSTMVIVNLNAPEITITDPASYSYTNSPSVPVYFTYFDKNGDFNHFDIYVNDTLKYTNLNPSTIVWGIELEQGNGIYNITVEGTDDANNKGKDFIYVTLDTIDPTINIISPLDSSVVNDDISLSWSASDIGSDIDYFEIELDGKFITSTSSFSEIVSLGIDRDYTVDVIAFDLAGNSAFDQITVTKDSINPTVNITSHPALTYTSSSTANIIWSASDNFGGTGLDHSEVTVNGVEVYSDVGFSASISLGGEGVKSIVVTTLDIAGNIAQDSVTIVVDSTSPAIIIDSPVNNFNTSLNSVIVNWNSSDIGSGVKQYNIIVNSIQIETITNPDITYTTIPLASDGLYTITIQAVDYLDHLSQDSITVNRNSSLDEFLITNPAAFHVYSSVTQIQFDWSVNNIDNITQFDVYKDGLLEDTISDNTSRTYLLDLGSIPVGNYPTFNITIVALTTNPSISYSDLRWIKIDQLAPVVNILSPINNSIISNQLIFLDWQIAETGTDLQSVSILVNGEVVNSWNASVTSQYLIINATSGTISIMVTISDLANNNGNETIFLQMYLLLPEVSIDLADPFYSNNQTFNFNLDIIDPQSGVKGIQVYLGSTLDNYIDYSTSIELSPFTLQINITAPTIGSQSFTIIIIDAYDREITLTREYIIDQDDPVILRVDIEGQSILNGASTASEISIDVETTNITFSAVISENVGIEFVQIKIISTSGNMTYQMLPTNVTGIYELNISRVDLPYGSYSIEVIIRDYAGNEVIQTYEVTLVEQRGLPWFLQGYYPYIFGGVLLVLIIFFITLGVVIRRRTVNLGWKNEVVTVAYILNGLPCVYMMNKPEMIKDDLLFGGAMTGIRGVLEEITGEKSKMKIQSVEMGEKRVMICPGNYGDAVLMVNKIKPIHKEKLIAFTKNFEDDYEHLLKQEDLLITPDTFPGANILVQIHFGITDAMQLVDDCEFEDVTFEDEFSRVQHLAHKQETQKPTPQEPDVTFTEPEPQIEIATQEPKAKPAKLQIEPVKSIENLLIQLDKDKQKEFIELIQLTQTAVDAILERDITTTRNSNADLLTKLELLLTSDNIPDQVNLVLQSIFTISQELVIAIDSLGKNDEQTFRASVEKASNIWIKEISEKW